MANVNIRVDDLLKRDTEIVLSELGLTLSAATNLFYKQVVRYGGIPLDLRVDQTNLSRKSLLAEGRELIKSIQSDSIINGTDKMTMDEIDAIIAESRQERRTKQA